MFGFGCIENCLNFKQYSKMSLSQFRFLFVEAMNCLCLIPSDENLTEWTIGSPKRC